MNSRTRRIFLAALAVTIVFATAPTWAQNILWDGDTDDFWNTATNWGGNNVPNAIGEDAQFGNTGVGPVNLNIAGTTSLRNIEFLAFTGTYDLDLNGNTLAIAGTGGGNRIVGEQALAGTVNITNGTFNITNSTPDMRVGYGFTTGSGSGTLNVSADANVAVNNLHIGYAEGGSGITATGSGSFTGTGSIANTLDLRIGDGAGGLVGDATGSLTLGSSVTSYTHATIGTPRLVRIGVNGSATSGADANGTMTTSTATTIFGSEFQLGRNLSTTAGTTATGTFDASNSLNTTITLTQGASIGRGLNANGTLMLSSGGLFTTINNVNVGDNNAGTNAGGTGTIDLNNANLALTGGTSVLTVDVSGTIGALVVGDSNGITIDHANNGALVIASGGKINLTFDDPNFTPTVANPYWGVRWLGDRDTALTNYYNSGDITVAIAGGSSLSMSDFDILYDATSNYTYLGFVDFNAVVIPEPGTAMLALAGGLMLLPRRRR